MQVCGDAWLRVALLSVVCLSAGCGHYEYDVVEPPELRQHVGDNSDVVFSRSPLVYRLRSYENHLVIRIQNPTPQPVLLLGGQSYAVDPQGQSHPFPTQTIAPGSFIKFILPPVPPEPVPTGPTIGFGFVVDARGAGNELPLANDDFDTRGLRDRSGEMDWRPVANRTACSPSPGTPGEGWGEGPVWHSEIRPPNLSCTHAWSPPRYLMAAAADEYWEWEGESDVRVSFTFRQGDQPPFTHAFVFHRRKI
jgi:hypothetical protein